jgi:signal transduction histidine kinase
MDKEFIANASHELRTPITILHGFAQALRDHPNLSRQTIGEIAEKIVRTSQRLENLIQSLLALADIDNFSESRLQTTNLVPIVEHCKEIILSIHPTAEISFSSKLPNAYVLASLQLIDLAIMNLLENAIKYSHKPPKIQILIDSFETDIRLEVRDEGIGIPEADLPYIFDRFYTVDKARSHKSGGTGLGLSIVKTIIEKHGGSVCVASQLGIGSSFTLSLPMKSDLHTESNR